MVWARCSKLVLCSAVLTVCKFLFLKLLLPLKGYSRKKQTRGRGRWGHGISRRIEKIEWGTPGVNKKRSGISRRDQKRNSVEFPWVLAFGLGNSNGCSTIWWNFQGWSFNLSGISKEKVTNLKIPGIFFKKVCPQHPLFGFFLE